MKKEPFEEPEFYSYTYLKDHAMIFVEQLGKEVVLNTLRAIIKDIIDEEVNDD